MDKHPDDCPDRRSRTLYVCLLLPFKGFVIIPGYTELRPAVLVPLLCSLLFGPAAAWGAAIGNLVGDVFGGMLGPGSIFGMLGNFMLGFLPYKLLEGLFRKQPNAARYHYKVLVGISAAAACAAIIGWGVDLLALVPFAILGSAIVINNSITAMFYPFLLLMLYPRIKRMGLLYTQVIPSYRPKTGLLAQVIGPFLVIAGSFGGLACGILLNAAGASESVKLILTPFVAAIAAGCLML